MPPTKSRVSWTVRSSKRERPAQDAQPRKRQRLSAPERLNQQTLTQKQFLVHPEPRTSEDELETIEPYKPIRGIPDEQSKCIPNSNQQTLTQIKFPPRQVSTFSDDEERLKAVNHEGEGSKKSSEPTTRAKSKSSRPKKKSKLQSNTITQMDYL